MNDGADRRTAADLLPDTADYGEFSSRGDRRLRFQVLGRNGPFYPEEVADGRPAARAEFLQRSHDPLAEQLDLIFAANDQVVADHGAGGALKQPIQFPAAPPDPHSPSVHVA